MTKDGIRFRVWDGQKMLDPDEATRQGYVLWPDGTLQHKEAFGGVALLYTGVRDVGGQEICEGDIVRYPVTDVPIQFLEGAFWLGSVLLCAVEEDMRVIGNIYENPELA